MPEPWIDLLRSSFAEQASQGWAAQYGLHSGRVNIGGFRGVRISWKNALTNDWGTLAKIPLVPKRSPKPTPAPVAVLASLLDELAELRKGAAS